MCDLGLNLNFGNQMQLRKLWQKMCHELRRWIPVIQLYDVDCLAFSLVPIVVTKVTIQNVQFCRLVHFYLFLNPK